MDLIDMPKDNRAKAGSYGETKKPKQFLLTDTASERLDALAVKCGVTRSEFIERSIRWIDEHFDTQLQRELGKSEDASDE
jgi:hypothetical protein